MSGNNVTMNTKAIETQSHNNNTSQKHSGPFYISPSLFDNKRLRQKRLRWAKALLAAAGYNHHHLLQRKKTERRKRDISDLRPDITIDLLSDDDHISCNAKINETKKVIQKSASIPMPDGPPPLVPISNLQPAPKSLLSQVYVYPGQAIELSKVPNITLIPVQNLTASSALPPIASVAPMPRRVKRKRKSKQPKRHEQPTIVNNESIVLSDDSDLEVASEESTPKLPKNTTNNLHSPTLSVGSATVPSTTITTAEDACKSPQDQTPKTTTYPTLLTPYSGQVDEEVTVSIVPRSSSAGTCPKSNALELFPMLPDETTVHTVIANRTYELSLTKLREGLASCGMPEFSNGQQKIATTRRKGQVDTPPMVSPTPAPISLKLSSDLSISLISDDEDDNPEQQQQERLAAESLLQKQPQLMVQHLQLPAGGILPAGANVALVGPPRLPPRRRKLG